jgi:hypothetical protein
MLGRFPASARPGFGHVGIEVMNSAQWSHHSGGFAGEGEAVSQPKNEDFGQFPGRSEKKPPRRIFLVASGTNPFMPR